MAIGIVESLLDKAINADGDRVRHVFRKVDAQLHRRASPHFMLPYHALYRSADRRALDLGQGETFADIPNVADRLAERIVHDLEFPLPIPLTFGLADAAQPEGG